MTSISADSGVLPRSSSPDDLSRLSAPDWKRLRNMGRRLAQGIPGLDGDDLLNEAVIRLLEDTRSWRSDLDAIRVVYSAMRSIASASRTKAKKGPIDWKVEITTLEFDSGDESAQVMPEDHAHSPEELLEGKQAIKDLEDYLIDDEDVLYLATLWAEGVRGIEAAGELAWSPQYHDNVRKKLKRRLDAYKAKGSES